MGEGGGITADGRGQEAVAAVLASGDGRRRWEAAAAMGGSGDEERSRGEEWRRDAGRVGGRAILNRYTSTAGGQTLASARGTFFLWRSSGRRTPVVLCLSGGRM